MSEQPIIEKIYSVFFKEVLPIDLILVLVWFILSIIAIYLPILNTTPVIVILAIPVILFIPGYSLIAALFPKDGDITLIERIALSIGLSIAIGSLITLELNYTSLGINLEPIVISLSVFTVIMILIAHYRRAILPLQKRFIIQYSNIWMSIRKEFFSTRTGKVDHIINAILILALLTAVITTIYIIAVPKQSSRFTEFFILGKNQTATDYPELIIAGQNYPMYIDVGNHEYRNMNYTIETWASLTEFDNVTNSTIILVMDPLELMSLTLAHNETTTIPYNLSLNKPGYNHVEFLLFNETIPGFEVTGSDRINASYRDLYLRINVKEVEIQEPST